MGAQQQALPARLAVLVRDLERVLRIAGRVAGWEVERLEVVEIGLDLGAGTHGIAHALENGDHLVHRFDERMLGAEGDGGSGEGDIERLGLVAGVLCASPGVFERGFDRRLQIVES